MVRLLGYDCYTEFAEAIQYQVIHTIHPEDRENVARDIGPQYYAGLEYTLSLIHIYPTVFAVNWSSEKVVSPHIKTITAIKIAAKIVNRIILERRSF